MKSRGGHPKAITSFADRDVTSVATAPSWLPAARGAYNATLPNLPGLSTPRLRH